MFEPAFRFALKQGVILKDPGVSTRHGEFSHAIQWLLIGWQQQNSSFLSKPVCEIYKQLGDQSSVYCNRKIRDIEAPNGIREQENSIWDLIVDQFPPLWPGQYSDATKYYTEENVDFRSPDNLHQFILSSEDPDLSLLKILCSERVKKRNYFSSETKEEPSNHTEYDVSHDPSLLLPKKRK